VIYVLGTAFTLWMAVEAVRRGDAGRWLWIILVFGPIGAGVYFFSEVASSGTIPLFGFRQRKVTAADLRLAELDVKRLDNGPSWAEYASLLRARKDYVRAIDAATRATERAPNDINARYELGLALLGADRFAEAVTALEAVVARERRYEADEALYALAKAQQGANDVAAACASLSELAQRRSRPEILFDLATVQGRLGQRDAARQALQRIVDEAEVAPRYIQHELRPWVRRAKKALGQLGG
jgi:tetratricopeptide (TPR) repeat protein